MWKVALLKVILPFLEQSWNAWRMAGVSSEPSSFGVRLHSFRAGTEERYLISFGYVRVQEYLHEDHFNTLEEWLNPTLPIAVRTSQSQPIVTYLLQRV